MMESAHSDSRHSETLVQPAKQLHVARFDSYMNNTVKSAGRLSART